MQTECREVAFAGEGNGTAKHLPEWGKEANGLVPTEVRAIRGARNWHREPMER